MTSTQWRVLSAFMYFMITVTIKTMSSLCKRDSEVERIESMSVDLLSLIEKENPTV